ncbi:hypothetical protein QOT17_010914 [Balamuthia mandrillaris]
MKRKTPVITIDEYEEQEEEEEEEEELEISNVGEALYTQLDSVEQGVFAFSDRYPLAMLPELFCPTLGVIPLPLTERTLPDLKALRF